MATTDDVRICPNARRHRMYNSTYIPDDGGRRRASLPAAGGGRRRSRMLYKQPSTIDEEDGVKSSSSTSPSDRVRLILQAYATRHGDVDCPPLFIQMNQLFAVGGGGRGQWRETFRWIKFEEFLDTEGNRWSKPHIPTPSLHDLLELRALLAQATTLLDLEADSFDQVIESVVTALTREGHVTHDGHALCDALRRPVTHQFDHADGQYTIDAEGDVRRTSSSLVAKIRRLTQTAAVDDLADDSSPTSIEASPSSPTIKPASIAPSTSTQTLKKSATAQILQDIYRQFNNVELDEDVARRYKQNMAFYKKMAAGTEATAIFVAHHAAVVKPVIAVVRLKHAVLLPGIVEVPLHTRFIFMLMCPLPTQVPSLRTSGACLGALMSDDVFQDVAFKAQTAEHLLDGTDEFMHQGTVLPPNLWDKSKRLNPLAERVTKRKIELSDDDDDEEEIGEHGHMDDPGLQPTGRLFGGLIADIRRKAPFYVSDFTDGLNLQCLATAITMYCALLAPIVTFGGLLAEATGNNMAAVENILSALICGTAFSLFAGQPLTIIVPTAPVLIFEEVSYHLCHHYGIDYLSFRFWINSWMALIIMLMVAVDASSLVRYVTRFTEETFTVLVAFAFLHEAALKMMHIYGETTYVVHNPHSNTPDCRCETPNRTHLNVHADVWFDRLRARNHWTEEWLEQQSWCVAFVKWDSMMDRYAVNGTTDEAEIDYTGMTLSQCEQLEGRLEGGNCFIVHDEFLMSLALMLGTFLLITKLRAFRTTPYLTTRVREAVADFAVIITLVVMVLLDYNLHIDTPKLNMPPTFKPTSSHRDGWLVNPLKNAPVTYLLAIVPATLATILYFMEQQIPAIIVNRAENKLRKGSGYHLDWFVLGLLVFVVGALGLPIYVATTVLSVNHVTSLRVTSDNHAPGERAVVLGTIEQRLTGLFSFVCVGLTLLMKDALKLIPMPVLYGIFMYMDVGVAAASGIQLIDRCQLMFMPAKHQPDYVYLRYVRLSRVHMFTMVQLGGLALLWAIKSQTQTAIFFPVMLVMMMVMRKLMEAVFTLDELKHLDDRMPEVRLRTWDNRRRQSSAERGSQMLSTSDLPSSLEEKPVDDEDVAQRVTFDVK